MHIKQVYAIVLAVVMMAWFAQGPIDQPKPAKKDATKIPASVNIAAPDFSGISVGEMVVGGKCNIEFINDIQMSENVHELAKGISLKLKGWAMDDQKERLPAQVIVRFTDLRNKHFYAPVQIGLARDDVRFYFKLSDRVSASGFELKLETNDFPLGEYALTLLMRFDDKTYICDNGRKINVK